MRMPLSEFLTNGDLKFVIIFYVLLGISTYYFFNKIKDSKFRKKSNNQLKTLFNWCLILSVFSLFLGLLHSFYFISNTNNVALNILFKGLANMMITPTLGIIISIIIKLFSLNFNKI